MKNQPCRPIATGSATFVKEPDGSLRRIPDPPPKTPLPPVLPFQWACAYGEDEFGLWQAFEVKGVRQLLRWIPPGEFWMGSPETEVERADIETRRRIQVAHGFWIADVACPRALWHVVLDESYALAEAYAGRPVEHVSWFDITQRFLPVLNRRITGLDMSLPTEIQWEYACRAGTDTPFWFGEQITPDQVNFSGSRPYADGIAGVDRGQTVPVRTLPPNGWGLYEMHGNVWEWCEDVFYSRQGKSSTARESGGVLDDVVHRVLRGGSWISRGGRCRSADRGSGQPNERTDSIGFRLARPAI